MEQTVEKELISIIVPVYNTEKYLRKCVDSLLAQSYNLIEVILIDDGSTDGSGLICDIYAQKDTRVKVIHQHNFGAAEARTKGIAYATGAYVMFVDSDDWVDSNICMALYQGMRTHNVESAMCGYFRSYPDRIIPRILYCEDTILKGREIVRKLSGPIGDEVRFPEMMECFNTMYARLYPISLVRDIIPPDNSKICLSEDLIFNLEAFSRIENSVYIPKAYYYYRKLVSNSVTFSYKPRLNEQWDYLYRYIRNHITENGYDHVYTKALENRIALNMLGVGLNCMSDNASFGVKVKRLKQAMENPERKKALAQLNISKMPIYWKIFYFCAKKNQAIFLGILLEIINRLKGMF